MTSIIDYGAGNIQSVKNALEALGEPAVITCDRAQILNADRVILPGVGAFGAAMAQINRRGLADTIRSAVQSGIPFLGICLGLQILFDSSEEDPDIPGLSLLPGNIVKIPDAPGVKIPHIGWNSLDLQKNCPLFSGVKNGEYVYFVHSFYLRATQRSDVAATAGYGVTMDVAVSRDNLFATQFHPEKSGAAGLKMLRNFIGLY